MQSYEYIESDGRLFLVRRDGRLDLPHPNEVPFAVDAVADLPGEDPIRFCVPRLERHPATWTSKDEVQSRPDIAPRVRAAVHATMPRVVCEGVCVEAGRLLLVKGNRGLTRDRWTLPGGFVRFGEHPADGLRREIREEIGVDADVGEALAVRSKLGETSRLHWIFFFYRAMLRAEPIANPDEIAEVRFVDAEDAIKMLSDAVMVDVIRELPEFGIGRARS